MISIKINVTRINKARLHKGEKGTYLNVVLFDKPDKFGNGGFVKEDVSKEDREAGIEGNIIGSWKEFGTKKPTKEYDSNPPARPSGPAPVDDSDDIPFAPNIL